MNSQEGRLTGSGIRTLPESRRRGMLQRIKLEGSGKSRRVRSVRYRVTGYRDPDTGKWVSRDPANGHYYAVDHGRHRTRSRPTGDKLRRTDMIALEVEVDRGRGSRVYFVSVPGLS